MNRRAAATASSWWRATGISVADASLERFTVITASVTASLVESSRRRFAVQSDVDVMRRLEEISDRLARIEAAGQSAPPSSPR